MKKKIREHGLTGLSQAGLVTNEAARRDSVNEEGFSVVFDEALAPVVPACNKY